MKTVSLVRIDLAIGYRNVIALQASIRKKRMLRRPRSGSRRLAESRQAHTRRIPRILPMPWPMRSTIRIPTLRVQRRRHEERRRRRELCEMGRPRSGSRQRLQKTKIHRLQQVPARMQKFQFRWTTASRRREERRTGRNKMEKDRAAEAFDSIARDTGRVRRYC